MTISKMLKALTDAGMSQGAIGKEIGLSQPSVYRALNGGPMQYEQGKKLEELYANLQADRKVAA